MANPISEDNKLNGLILVGGQSSRMGADKSKLIIHGVPQVDHLYQLINPLVSRTFLSEKHASDTINYPSIPDRYDFQGPLNGILSALKHDSTSGWLVVACDMPFIDQQSIEELIRARDSSKVATCYQNQQKQPEPLFCIYESNSINQLFSFYANKGRSPRQFLQEANIKQLEPSNWKVLENMNTPDEYKRFKKER